MSNEKVFRAVSVAGGEENGMTLQEARDQVEAWEDKGYSSYVEHMHDPEWEDAVVAAPITPYQVVESLGADREYVEAFVLKLIELLDWEVDHQDGGFMVYTGEAD